MKNLLWIWLVVLSAFAASSAPPPLVHTPWTTNAPGQTIIASNVVNLIGPAGPNGEGIATDYLVAATNAWNGGLNIKNYAKCDGITDDYAAFTNALAIARIHKQGLYIPPGTNLISKTIILQEHDVVFGAPVDDTYKGNNPQRSVIQVIGSIGAIKLPPLTYPNDNQAYWTPGVTLRDVTVIGPYSESTAVNDCVGVDFTGTRNSTLWNVNIQGFGTGFKMGNCSEMNAAHVKIQNCAVGALFQRLVDPLGINTYDCMVNCQDVKAIDNNIAAVFDNPRSVTFSHCELIRSIGGGIADNYNVAITNCQPHSQIVFSQSSIENHSVTNADFEIDKSGVGQLTIEDSNLETDGGLPIVHCLGWFGELSMVRNTMDRTYFSQRPNPVVFCEWPTAADGNTITNDFGYARAVTVSDNIPQTYDGLVRVNGPGMRPENEWVPDDFVQINPQPNTDHAENGIISAGGDVQWNPLSTCGQARAWWNSTTTNNSYTFIANTNQTLGVDSLWCFVTAYATNDVPIIVPYGWGEQGPGWLRSGPTIVGRYTNQYSGGVFNKYAFWLANKGPNYVTNGLTWVQIQNIYGAVGASNTGVERFTVYASRKKNQDANALRTFTATAKPSTGLEGYHQPGEQPIWNTDFTANPKTLGWLNTSAGRPGTWLPINSFTAPDFFGTLSPGINTPGTYARGFGANVNWPFYFQTIYDASSVDQYTCLNCFIDGGTKANPTFTASNSGGRIIRMITGSVSNDGVLEFGHTTSGTGQPLVIDMRIDTDATTNEFPVLFRDNNASALKRLTWDTNRFLKLAP